MPQHNHIIVYDKGALKCIACAEEFRVIEEDISIVNSGSRARRILDEIGSAGGYNVSSVRGDFPAYVKSNIGYDEEITAVKLGERSYRVYKKFSLTGGVVTG